LFDECRRNPKKCKRDKQVELLRKKRGHDAHYNNNCHRSSGDESPSERNTPIPSDREVDDDKSSDDQRSNSNYHIDDTPKKRRFVEKNNVGHKSPTPKKRKSLVEPDLGMKKIPNKNRISKKDGDLLNIFTMTSRAMTKNHVCPSPTTTVCPSPNWMRMMRSGLAIDGPRQWD
jgi:hypothetical protein